MFSQIVVVLSQRVMDCIVEECSRATVSVTFSATVSVTSPVCNPLTFRHKCETCETCGYGVGYEKDKRHSFQPYQVE